MKQDGSSEDRGYYPQRPLDPEAQQSNQQSAPSAPHYYGTFQGNPGYPQPARPGFPYPGRGPQYGYQTVPGYPVYEVISAERQPERLPCCGIGIGWFLFIIGWFLASIPWYVGAIILLCTRHDPRERVGLVCCTIAAVLSLIAAIVSGTTASA